MLIYVDLIPPGHSSWVSAHALEHRSRVLIVFLGHLKLIWQAKAGEIEELFMGGYGSVVRIKAPFMVC